MNTEIFPNSKIYENGYCVVFARGITPRELLARVTGRDIPPIFLSRSESDAVKAFGEDLSDDDIPDLDIEVLHSSKITGTDGPLIRAGSCGNWSFAIESEGPYLADVDILKSISRDTVVLAASETETAAAWISYLENGETLSSFDPLFPDNDYGKSPEVLERLTGHIEAIKNGDRTEAHVNAMRRIQESLDCAFPQNVDTGRLLAVRIAGGY
ncbi:DUF6461 domain-containing protein [Streptomyces sp. NBC_01089]|uniref:DUF6461 domain-containing protein n=1 Tax=Streptomyces sp. NBC_01089 TaxID=2903747 RepID=UPI0038660774|nr:DUF6461 domain-containing protein [Streptomyces sp. NBC_01089]